ncbi:hypothetical protein CGH61_24460 [Vibrio parahaemolyticus]|nr:hypothetical protein CGH61_24460 [Vibrio parahaemolyticus]
MNFAISSLVIPDFSNPGPIHSTASLDMMSVIVESDNVCTGKIEFFIIVVIPLWLKSYGTDKGLICLILSLNI